MLTTNFPVEWPTPLPFSSRREPQSSLTSTHSHANRNLATHSVSHPARRALENGELAGKDGLNRDTPPTPRALRSRVRRAPAPARPRREDRRRVQPLAVRDLDFLTDILPKHPCPGRSEARKGPKR